MRIRRFRGLTLLAAAVALALMNVPSAAAQTTGWQPGPGAVSDNTYLGAVDSPTSGAIVLAAGSFLVRGWFVDSTAQGWAGTDNVQVWLGTMDGGGQLLAGAQVGQPRPDVAMALNNPYWSTAGFLATVPGGAVPGGPQTLYVYAHTAGKGWWFKTIAVNGGGSSTSVAAAPGGPPQIQVVLPTLEQNLSQSSRQFTFTGEVNDPSHTTIDVWFDGERNSTGGADLGTAIPASDGSWSLLFAPNQYPTGHHNLYIYATDTATGLQTEDVAGFNIVN